MRKSILINKTFNFKKLNSIFNNSTCKCNLIQEVKAMWSHLVPKKVFDDPMADDSRISKLTYVASRHCVDLGLNLILCVQCRVILTDGRHALHVRYTDLSINAMNVSSFNVHEVNKAIQRRRKPLMPSNSNTYSYSIHMYYAHQDYFTIKVCSVGKSDRRRDVTQGNPLRPSKWGFKIGYFPNIYGDFCTFSRFSLHTEDQIFPWSNFYRCAMYTYGARPLQLSAILHCITMGKGI